MTAGARTVTATYTSGDLNFGGSVSGGGTVTSMVTPTVNPNTPKITVTPSPATSVATQSVLFTALVEQQAPAGATLTGTAVPTGSIVFTSSDNGSAPICTVPVTPGSSGSASAICAYAFKSTTSGAAAITANYTTGDMNFNSGAGSSTPAPTVQNFCLAYTAADCTSTNPPVNPTITVSQGNSNTSDPFTSSAVTVTSTPIAGFPDSLDLSCRVQNSAGSVTIPNAPTCKLTPGTLAGNGNGPSTSTLTISASANSPLDQYTVIVTGTDSKFPNLSHQTVEQLLVDVVSTTGTLSLSAGASATQSIEFNTATAPAGTTLVNFTCGTISPVPATGSFACSGPSNPVAISTTSTFTNVAITIAVTGSTTASVTQESRSGSVATAAFWGIPLFALLVWAFGSKSPRRNFFRFLGMILLIVGLSNTIGCGGSFKPPATVTGGPAPGLYHVQVVGTDAATKKLVFSAVVPVQVVSNSN
jgi:hypothetical protein